MVFIQTASHKKKKKKQQKQMKFMDANIHLEIVYEFKCINHQNNSLLLLSLSVCACDMRWLWYVEDCCVLV